MGTGPLLPVPDTHVGHTPERFYDGQQWRRCRTCRLKSNKAAVERYHTTAKGVLTRVRHEATQRGNR